MAGKLTELIAPKTAAEDAEIWVGPRTVTLTATDLANSETIPIEILPDGTAANAEALVQAGVVQVLTADDYTTAADINTAVYIRGPGKFNVAKGVTAGTVGVYMWD